MLARRSGRIVWIPLVFALLMIYFSHWPTAVPFVVFAAFAAFFFRDPRRKIGRGIVAAADGVIREVGFRNGHLFISTFMNVHNVHVNRVPLKGKVAGVRRIRGGHRPAYGANADNNSRVVMTLSTGLGRVRVTLIAGTFAWRIVPYVRKGQVLRKGRRIGMIRFGSRVDVELPADRTIPRVEVGDRVKAGVTTIAEVVQ